MRNILSSRKVTAFAMTLILCAFLSSCKVLKKTVEVPVYIHDTTYTAKEVHDSTYVDRWHTVEVKGDTVYVRDSHMSVTYRTITDTAYKYIEKPVTVTVEQIKEVAKPLSWWLRSRSSCYGWYGRSPCGVSCLHFCQRKTTTD